MKKKGYPKKCPNCKINLEGEDIYLYFLREYAGDRARALDAAADYGWTKEKPCNFSKVIAVYDMEADRTMAYECPECHKILDLKVKP